MCRVSVCVCVYALLLVVTVVKAFRMQCTPLRLYHSKHTRLSNDNGDVIAIADKPRWAGNGNDDILSSFVNALISFKPLFSVMKVMARRTLIGTAEKNGITWSETCDMYEQRKSNIQDMYDSIIHTDKTMSYPEYYTQEFHAYDNGNLNWQAAYECESATLSMALRVWPREGYTADEAQDKLRYSYTDAIKSYAKYDDIKTPNKIIDIGSSVGISTFYLAKVFDKSTQIDGLDLSPYFLSIAKVRQADVIVGAADDDKFKGDRIDRINWIYAKAEDTKLPSDTYDLTSISFLFHELPQDASTQILREMYRITKPGGIIAITDNNPRSKVIQNLPPALFTLMKSTEPWSDEYYVYNIEDALVDSGFTDVVTVPTDPRHRTILARKQ